MKNESSWFYICNITKKSQKYDLLQKKHSTWTDMSAFQRSLGRKVPYTGEVTKCFGHGL